MKCYQLERTNDQHIRTTYGKHHPLKHVEQLKDLGIIMSTNLDFDKHISEKVNKANSMMGLIRRTFNFIDEENFMLLCKAFVLVSTQTCSATQMQSRL